MLTLPDAPTQSPLSIARRPVLRETPLGEELSARVSQGFEESAIGQIIEDFSLPEAEYDPSISAAEARSGVGRRRGYMDEDAYKASPFFREGVEWDQRMTESRAEALAEIVDQRNYRNSLIERSPGGVGRAALGFGASLVGAAPDPVNYVPFFGPAARAVAVSRMGFIGGRVTVGAAEGAFGAALVSPYVMQNINRKGGNITAADVAMDIALSAVLGGAFGAGGALIEKRRAAKALRVDGAKQELNALAKAVEDVADDVPVDVRGVSFMARGSDALPDAIARPDVRLLPDAIEGSRLPDAQPRPRIQTVEEARVADSGVDIDQDVAFQFRSVARPRDIGAPRPIENPDALPRTGPLEGQRVQQRSVLPPVRPRQVTDFEDGTTAFLRRMQDQRAREIVREHQAVRQSRPADFDQVEEAGQAREATGESVPRRTSDGKVFDKAFAKAVDRRQTSPLLDDIETVPDSETIPYAKEGEAQVKARSVERTDYADAKPETMADPEMMEIDEMRKAGELDDVDEALMREADEVADAAENYAVSYETLAGCVVRHG